MGVGCCSWRHQCVFFSFVERFIYSLATVEIKKKLFEIVSAVSEERVLPYPLFNRNGRNCYHRLPFFKRHASGLVCALFSSPTSIGSDVWCGGTSHAPRTCAHTRCVHTRTNHSYTTYPKQTPFIRFRKGHRNTLVSSLFLFSCSLRRKI